MLHGSTDGMPGQGHGSAPLLNPWHRLEGTMGSCPAEVSCVRATGSSAAPINKRCWRQSNRDHLNSEHTWSRIRQVPRWHRQGELASPSAPVLSKRHQSPRSPSVPRVFGGHQRTQVPHREQGVGTRGGRSGHTMSRDSILALGRKTAPALGVSGAPPGLCTPIHEGAVPRVQGQTPAFRITPSLLHAPS